MPFSCILFHIVVSQAGLMTHYLTPLRRLVPVAPDLRPADVLTIAAHQTSSVAVDIGIKVPHAQNAGLDCTETMKQYKVRHYEVHLPELE